MSSKQLVLYPPTQEQRSALPLVSDVQFMDNFASTAMNTKFAGVFGKGIYQGFAVVGKSAGVVTVGISSGGDTAIVNPSKGISLTINMQKAVNLTVPTGVKKTLVLEGFYEYGKTTTQVDTKSTQAPAELKLVDYGTETSAQVIVADVEYTGSGSVIVDYLRRQYGSPVNTYSQQYLDNQLFFQSEPQFNAMREENKQRFAASDFVYHGKHYPESSTRSPVNEGLWTDTLKPNVLYLGRSTTASGNSKEKLPLFNISGVLAKLNGVNQPVNTQNIITLPSAPDGTVTYDSATGVVTDFKKDAGHYSGVVGYETVAQRAALSGLSAQNEAVTSAFEGLIPNSDFRFGAVSFGWVITTPANGEITTDGAVLSGSTHMWANYVFEANTDYEITVEIENWTQGNLTVNQYGVGANDGGVGTIAANGRSTIKWNSGEPTGDNGSESKISLYKSAASTFDGTVKSIVFKKVSTEVVVNRVDMTGLEIWAEEITNGEVFPTCIQNASSVVISGVPMRLSSRPKSYFQVYSGQYADGAVNDEFYCWDWTALTAAQKAQVATYLGDTAFVNAAGNLVQWRIRNRSFAGLGNGDWGNVDSAVNTELMYSSTSGYIVAQGRADAVNAFWHGASRYTAYEAHTLERYQKGVFSTRESQPGLAYNGECYFYVIATVPRLNQGAYHPQLNSFGAGRWRQIDSDGLTIATPANWHVSAVLSNGVETVHATSKKQCFIKYLSGVAPASYPAAATFGGDISSSQQGRPDGKYYDAIYASGLGGVIDHRLKYGAWDTSTSEQAAVVREEVKSGVYRGRERLTFTSITAGGNGDSQATHGWRINSAQNPDRFQIDAQMLLEKGIVFEVGTRWHVVNGNTGVVTSGFVASVATGLVNIKTDSGDNNVADWAGLDGTSDYSNIWLIVESKTDITVEGQFTQTDVIGNPANILQCDALKDGWFGSWVPQMPDGTSKAYSFTRKCIDSTLNRQYTSDLGVTWSNAYGISLDVITNSRSESWSDAQIAIYNYTAFAKQTKPSSSLPILNGVDGIGEMFIAMDNSVKLGSLLSESIFNNIQVGNAALFRCCNYGLTRLGRINDTGLLDTTGATSPAYDDINGINPSDSKAGKFLFHQINDSEQASLNILANELIYDSVAGDWGDNSTVKVIANGVFTDDNGNTCKSDIHKLAKSYGWIKNNI
ncbi:hypothetical protein NTE19_003371 [Vibrio fluvialis]|nr:hypothetical protein [Vibrio fluvialis]